MPMPNYKKKTMSKRKVPYTIRKAYKKNCFRVMNKKTKKIFSKCTSLENAIRQDKLLRALLYNKNFNRI
jgi:DNA polymerase III delta subunit